MKKIIISLLILLFISSCQSIEDICIYKGGQIVDKESYVNYGDSIYVLSIRYNFEIIQINTTKYDYQISQIGNVINCKP